MKTTELISHYTSIDGFQSIIESEIIRATNVRFLNDNKEYIHAFEIFNAALSNFSIEINSKAEDDMFFLSKCCECINSIHEIGSEQHYISRGQPT